MTKISVHYGIIDTLMAMILVIAIVSNPIAFLATFTVIFLATISAMRSQ